MSVCLAIPWSCKFRLTGMFVGIVVVVIADVVMIGVVCAVGVSLLRVG